jgi:hypothetical protein
MTNMTNMQSIWTPPLFISKNIKNIKKYVSQIGPTPRDRSDLRMNQYAKYASFTEYAKYGFIRPPPRVRLAGRRSNTAVDMFGRGAAVTTTLVSFGNA